MTIWTPVLDRSKPLYLAIADAIARDVEGGTLAQGARLPPQRELAWKLGVTLGTVTRAYKEAEERGLLAGEVGRGSYIRRPRERAPIPPTQTEQDGIIDLSHAIAPPVVTAEEFDAAMLAVMRDPNKLNLLDYAPPEGFPQHRAMAADWLKRSGIEVSDQHVFISAGAHLGLVTVLQAIAAPGESIMAEEVNYALLPRTFENAMLNTVPIAMDEDGLIPEALDKAARETKARFLYLVPSLQNPTTNTMSRRRRDAIVSVARARDITIIEDDIFRLVDERMQPPTFYALAPERTYHVTSLSKALAPGLRVGIIATPPGQERILRTFMRSMASRNVGLSGELARFWIESDMVSAILTRARNELAARRATFIEVFKDSNFRCEVAAPFAWLELPQPWTSGRFAGAMAARQVRVTPGTSFHLVPGRQSRHIRVCFGGPKASHQARRGFEIIRELMNSEPEEDFTPVA